MNNIIKTWWKWLKYGPDDPRFDAGGDVKIAVIGGGTGLSTLLRGLKQYSNKITAVVTVADDGASSGILRREFDILPPGDIRQCISALSYDEKLISGILEYRFSKSNKSFGGHTLGNIWITALSNHLGSFERALEATTAIFQTAGRVLPATLEKIELCAEFENGTVIKGESKLKAGKKIAKVFLNKKGVRAYKEAVLAIKSADLIILGPGSLFTSVIPNILISGVREAVSANSKAVRVFVANCSTEVGETENYTIDDHIKALNAHAGKRIFDYCLVNSKVLKESRITERIGEINNITTNKSVISEVKIKRADVVNSAKPLYHDPQKLAKALISLYNDNRKSK
ncbi:MAG: gluconeogenesis factor YvcK family protein [Patescibacteria group bacterium]